MEVKWRKETRNKKLAIEHIRNKGATVEKSNKELAIEHIRDKGAIVEKTNKELAIEHECEGMCVKVCYF
jgi:hypothetical protein